MDVGQWQALDTGGEVLSAERTDGHDLVGGGGQYEK